MNKDQYRYRLEAELIEKYGMLISGKHLSDVLGYPSIGAFRKSLQRGKVEVPILSFKNRRGKYALTKDVSEWLTSSRYKSMEKTK